MAPRDVVARRVAQATFAAATALVLLGSLRELGARLALRPDGASAAADGPLELDADLATERALVRLEAGDPQGARRELSTALASRPRDAFAVLTLATAAESASEKLRLALVAARFAPYDVSPARFALATGVEAARTSAARAATARETARRLRLAGVVDGVADVESEASRLERDAAAALEAALAVHGATSPTAREMRFLDDDVARARGLLHEADAGR